MVNKELFEEVIEYLKNGSKNCLKTGFFDLDEALDLNDKGALITIGGRPAMGKTSFIYNLLENISQQGKKCILFSLERSAKLVIQRLLCQVAEIDTIKIRRKNMQQNDWRKMSDAMNKWVNVDFVIDDTRAITVKDIEAKIKEVRPKVVFIDYLQLINSYVNTERRFFTEDVMRELKRIAGENKIIIFLGSQLSRAVESRADKHPLLSDFRDSGSIENISDVVIFIHRPGYYYLDDESGLAEIIVAKNHFGPCVTINLKFNPSIMKFYNLPHNEVF